MMTLYLESMDLDRGALWPENDPVSMVRRVQSEGNKPSRICLRAMGQLNYFFDSSNRD
jgi:hypothetical protein